MPLRKQEKQAKWTEQAFVFKLDPSPETRTLIRRHIGMRRKAHNWAVDQITNQVEMYNRQKEAGLLLPEPPRNKKSKTKVNPLYTLQGLRKFWNKAKKRLCVDVKTGKEWWPELSKEAAANGIDDAATGFWNWVKSRNGTREGPPMGFPQFKKKGRGKQSYRISTGSYGLADRRHVKIPRLGTVRIWENARRLDRLTNKGMARIKSATISEEADGFFVSFQVEMLRPQVNHKPSKPNSKIGVDLGTRMLAVIADSDGKILRRIPNPRHLNKSLKQLKKLQKQLARAKKDSKRREELKREISKTHARVKAQRRDAMHKLTTWLAKTHGTIVIEDLNIKGLLKKGKGFGGKKRRRDLADAALGEFRRQMTYKCEWYGSNLIVADRWFPSSQICHVCGVRNKIKDKRQWTCKGCESVHDRDDNAAINLARYDPVTKQSWQCQEGTQQSCCCGVCSPEKEQVERFRGSKTHAAPSLRGRSEPFDGRAASIQGEREGSSDSTSGEVAETKV
jgi:putative transposase